MTSPLDYALQSAGNTQLAPNFDPIVVAKSVSPPSRYVSVLCVVLPLVFFRIVLLLAFCLSAIFVSVIFLFHAECCSTAAPIPTYSTTRTARVSA